MLSRSFSAICIILIVLGLPYSVSAGNYRFVTFQYPPLGYVNADGKAEGIAVAIVKKVMRALGDEVEIKVFPWPRALNMVRFGRADAIFTAYKNAEREQYLDYSKQVLIPQEVYFYKKKGSDIAFNGLFDPIKSKRIGVVSTLSYGRIFDQAKTDLMIDKARTLENSFIKLMLNRVDLVPSHHFVAEYTLRKLNLKENIVRVPHKIESVPSFIAFSKKRSLSELRNQFDKQLMEMKRNGEYDDMIKDSDFGYPESR